MNNFLILAVICIVCFLLYWLLNFLSVKAYRSGFEILGSIFAWSSIISAILSAICLISTIAAIGILIL